MTTDDQRRAFMVVDAVDELESHLGAFRAVQQLATSEQAASEQALPQLRRGDLAALLSVLNASITAKVQEARAAALYSATHLPI